MQKRVLVVNSFIRGPPVEFEPIRQSERLQTNSNPLRIIYDKAYNKVHDNLHTT